MAKIDEYYNAVRTFHLSFKHPAAEHPSILEDDRVACRAAWIQEEIDELRDAKDIVEQADAFIDVLYFAFGGLVELGIQPKPLFNIVHQANMSKLWDDGQPRFREDGKIQKPPHWKDPAEALAAEVRRQLNGQQARAEKAGS